MIYRGFNQVELQRITEILDRHGVQYQAGIPQEAMDHINDHSKRVNHKFMDGVLQIEIDKEEFVKIPERDVARLFDLRIYKEEDSPFTDEELAGLAEEAPKPQGPKADDNMKTHQIIAFSIFVAGTLFFLWKIGIFN